MRLLLRLPNRLYDWRLGWLLGRRALRLTHCGRRSGRTFQTALEIIGRDPESDEVMVLVARGRRADWYLNVLHASALEIATRSLRYRPKHRTLEVDEAVDVMEAYERRHRLLRPVVHLVLSRLLGWHYDGSPSDRHRLVQQLPIVAFSPAR